MANLENAPKKELGNSCSTKTGRTHLGVLTLIQQEPSLCHKFEHEGGIKVYWENGVEVEIGPCVLGTNEPQNLSFTLEGSITGLQRAWDVERESFTQEAKEKGTFYTINEDLEERWAEFLVEQVKEVGIWFTKPGSPGGQFFNEEVDRLAMKEMRTIYAGILYYAVSEHSTAFRELRRLFEEGTTV